MQESDREWPGALLARRTRTIRLCSSDARSRGQPWPPPPIRFRRGGVEEKKGKKGGLAIPCARATRGLRRPSLDARTTGKRQADPPKLDKGMEVVLCWHSHLEMHRQALKKQYVPVYSSGIKDIARSLEIGIGSVYKALDTLKTAV